MGRIRSEGSPAAALARRLLGFSTLPFLASALPLIALPVVARAASTDDWAAMNVGLSVGAFASAIGLVGWNILGTPLVAMAQSDIERRRLYARSFYIRIIVVVIASAVSAVVAIAISPSGTWAVASSFATASALNGISLSWYAVGVASPRLVLLYEVLPRTIATAGALGIVLLTGDVVYYGLLLCLSVLIGTAAFHVTLHGRFLPGWPGLRVLRDDVADMRHAWGTESVGSLYANAPVPIAGIVAAPAAAAVFASNDKIYRYGILGVGAAGNALQGWVLEARDHHRRRRNVVALLLMAVIAIIGWLVLAVFGPTLSGWMFGADKQGDPLAFHYFAIAFIGVTMSTPLIRNILIPARKERQVFVFTLIAALAGVLAMALLGASFGIVGVAAGFAISEVATLLACVYLTLRTGLAHHETSTGSSEEQ